MSALGAGVTAPGPANASPLAAAARAAALAAVGREETRHGHRPQSDVAANLQIGPTSLGMVRIYVEAEGGSSCRSTSSPTRPTRSPRRSAPRPRRPGRSGQPGRGKGRQSRASRQARRRVVRASGARDRWRRRAAARRCGRSAGSAPGAGRRQGRRLGPALDLGVIGVGEDQPGVRGQELGREICVHRPEEAVAPLEIAPPLPVRDEVGPARLALDDPESRRAGRARSRPPAGPARARIRQRGEVEAAQVPADAAGQPLAGRSARSCALHRAVGDAGQASRASRSRPGRPRADWPRQRDLRRRSGEAKEKARASPAGRPTGKPGEHDMADAAAHPHDDHDAPGFFTRWFMSTNHKDIGILYLVTAATLGHRRGRLHHVHAARADVSRACSTC